MKTITTNILETVSGGALGNLTATTPARRNSGSSNLAMQTALSGVSSALDSLKNNQKSSLDQLLPIAMMAKWIRQS